MNIDLVFPVFAQVALTIALMLATGAGRYRSVASGEVRVKDIVLGQRAWPIKLQQLGNAANNQWESPTLFYALIAFALVLEAQSAALLPMAWAWFALRFLHAAIYVTSNNLRFRFLAFVSSFALLLAMWIVLFLETLSR